MRREAETDTQIAVLDTIVRAAVPAVYARSDLSCKHSVSRAD